MTVARALAALGLAPGADAALVGDRRHDAEAARANRIAVRRRALGDRRRGGARAAGADPIVLGRPISAGGWVYGRTRLEGAGVGRGRRRGRFGRFCPLGGKVTNPAICHPRLPTSECSPVPEREPAPPPETFNAPRPSRRAARPPGARSPARGPVPGPAAGAGAAVEAVEDVRQVAPGRCPAPWSRTRRPVRAGRDLDRRPAGRACAALSSRLLTARASRSGTPSTTAGSSRSSNATPGAWRRARSTASATSASSRTSSRTGRARRRARARSGRRPARRAPRPGPARRRAAARARRRRAGLGQHLDVGAQRGDRRAQLVRGVGHELALGGDRALQRVEHRVEAGRELADLVVARRPRSGARGPRSRRCGAPPR